VSGGIDGGALMAITLLVRDVIWDAATAMVPKHLSFEDGFNDL